MLGNLLGCRRQGSGAPAPWTRRQLASPRTAPNSLHADAHRQFGSPRGLALARPMAHVDRCLRASGARRRSAVAQHLNKHLSQTLNCECARLRPISAPFRNKCFCSEPLLNKLDASSLPGRRRGLHGPASQLIRRGPARIGHARLLHPGKNFRPRLGAGLSLGRVEKAGARRSRRQYGRAPVWQPGQS